MIIQCKSCSKKFIVRDRDIPNEGRMVQCGYCSVTWHQMPIVKKAKILKKSAISKSTPELEEEPSVDSIKASDGKTYRFLGTQWAQLLPSGKTGLFARKKISQELDEITGRTERKIGKKRRKKIEEVDPSSENLDNNKKLPEIYKPKQGLGFFGYIFLLIIIGFSFVGLLKTFEDDLIDYYPETELIFELLDEQLVYVSESVKNMIVIIKDLISSY
tara:strand:- start:500 stop:1147 length:648 start_codon:yes stop_codon:yes gene_type:complete